MPIIGPLNDHACLGRMHEDARAFRDTQAAKTLAEQCETSEGAIELIRSLEQRDDFGDPNDGPRLSCEVSQRLRLPAIDPNCFERTALYLALVSILEPAREVTSATLMLDDGLHSFPVELVDGIPRAVVLDPMTDDVANTMHATAWQLRNASPLTKSCVGPWFNMLAANACRSQGAEHCYDTAMGALRTSLLTGCPIMHHDEIECVLSLAGREAGLYGPKGRTAYDRVCRSIRNLSLSLDRGHVARFLNDVIKEGKPYAGEAIKLALVAKFGPAAQIALQDKSVVVAEPGPPEGSEDEQIHALLALTQLDDEDSDAGEDSDASARTEIHSRMRRMTLAFRPTRKDI